MLSRVKIKNLFFQFWPILFIFLVWFIFASPYFIKGRVPYASTYQVNHFAPWDAYSQFAGPVKNGAMPDVIDQIYPWRHLAIELWKQGTVPLWNPYSFSGTPLLANYQSAALQPLNLLFFIFHFIDAWSILVLLQPLLAGLFTYIFVRSLKRSKTASLISAVSFMFCGFITVWMGYATLGYAILYLPLSLYAVERYYGSQKFRFLILLAFTMPLSFLSGHFQISLYFLLTISIYIFYKFITQRNVFNTLHLIFYIFLGLLLTMPQILPSVEFYLRSLRSGIFQKIEVMPFSYLPTFIAPDFFGNPVTRNDWFGHYAEWNAYIGVIPLMLAFYGIFSKKNTQTIFMFLFGLIACLIAFNTPFLNLMVALRIPVLSTSAASRVIVIFSFMFACLSSFGFDNLLEDLKRNNLKKIILWIGTFLGVFIILWAIVLLKLFLPIDKIIIVRQNLILPTLIFIAAFLAIVISFFRFRSLFLISCFLLLIAFDMLRFVTKWQAFDPKNLVFPQIPTTLAFSKIATYHRVMGNFGGEDAVYYRLPSVEGYDALYSKRYGEFISSLANGRLTEPSRSVVLFPKDGLYAPSAINLLDIRFLVYKLADDHAPWTFPFWTYPKDQFKRVYKDQQYEFYKNTKAFPHVFLVKSYKAVTNPQGILDTMFAKNFNLRQEVVLEKNIGRLPKAKNPGKAKIVNYRVNRIDISVVSKKKSLLFLSEVFYPGWKAYIDGRKTEIYRADYAFRSIVVPAGNHKVEFIYDPLSFRIGVYMFLAGFISIFAATALLKKKNKLF